MNDCINKTQLLAVFHVLYMFLYNTSPHLDYKKIDLEQNTK